MIGDGGRFGGRNITSVKLAFIGTKELPRCGPIGVEKMHQGLEVPFSTLAEDKHIICIHNMAGGKQTCWDREW